MTPLDLILWVLAAAAASIIAGLAVGLVIIIVRSALSTSVGKKGEGT